MLFETLVEQKLVATYLAWARFGSLVHAQRVLFEIVPESKPLVTLET